MESLQQPLQDQLLESLQQPLQDELLTPLQELLLPPLSHCNCTSFPNRLQALCCLAQLACSVTHEQLLTKIVLTRHTARESPL